MNTSIEYHNRIWERASFWEKVKLTYFWMIVVPALLVTYCVSEKIRKMMK